MYDGPAEHEPTAKSAARILRDAVAFTLGASALGLVINLVHPEAIPYLAKEEYEVLVPCPEPGGEVTPVEPHDIDLGARDTFFVDARKGVELGSWSIQGAVNVPFDYLDPTPKETLEDLSRTIAQSRVRRVLVFGDGATPDTGEQLAKEISAYGIKHVCFARGGAPALRKLAGGRP